MQKSWYDKNVGLWPNLGTDIVAGADPALAIGRGPNIFRSKLTKILTIDCT